MTDKPIQLNPMDKVPITLEAQQWNMVLAALAEAPWKIAAPLMDAIRAQCMTYERRQIEGTDDAPTSVGDTDA